MSASFPNAKKTFTPIVDGVTYVEAINANTAYDEIEAMQTMFGAMGVTQGYTESLKNASLRLPAAAAFVRSSSHQIPATPL